MSNIYKSAAGELAIRTRYFEFLKRWPVPNVHLRVPTREGETFVVACGDNTAPPLLLLHGSAANSAMWTFDVAPWAAHFRVYAIDMIGEPGLSAPSRPPLNSDVHALWLDDVLQGLQVKRACIAGVSLGGWLALDYATRRPNSFDALALLCPGGVGRQKTGILFQALFLRMFGSWGTRKLREKVLGRAPANLPPRAQEFVDFVSLIHEHFLPRRVKLPIFSDEMLQRLRMPVLAILGAKDVMLDSADTRRRLARNLPHADIRYLPDAGHFIPRQTATILEFLTATVMHAR